MLLCEHVGFARRSSLTGKRYQACCSHCLFQRTWTIVCRFSKQAHFIPVRKKIKPDKMARIFMIKVFKYHGMPQSIVCDRDPRMTSLFWKGIFENMGTTLKFSSSFHPQTDGQLERTIQTLEDMLRACMLDFQGS